MKRKHIITLIFAAFCPMIFSAYGQKQAQMPEHPSEHSSQHHGHISFIENGGQWEEFIKFKSEMRGGALFFEQNKVTYLFVDPEYLEKMQAAKFSSPPVALDTVVTCYAYRMNFLRANEHSIIEGVQPLVKYLNYYIGNDPKKWASEVKQYEQIRYRQLYKGIDLLFYEHDHAYKYEFIVEVGANPDAIRMQYEGADKISLKKKNLSIKVGKHETIEFSPVAYQLSENGEKEAVECRFVVDGKEVYFALEKYDANKPLIIDPQLIFASYSGSTADNWGSTATYDNSGNLYGAGIASNVSGILPRLYPTTLGAFQVNNAGDWDIAITKFRFDGTQAIFSTYLGGSGADFPHSMIVNDADELYVFSTTSSSNFPTTTNAYQTAFGGGSSCSPVGGVYYTAGADVAISRFNANGTALLSSTYFGTNGNDGLNMSYWLAYNYADQIRGEIQLDASGNVYIASATNSSNLPTSPGAFSYGGGQDGFIAKFSYNLQNLIWCTYLGGSGDDAIYSMKMDNVGNIYVCGGTTSSNFPISSGAVISPTQPGDRDGFIAKIAPSGTLLLASTYYGRSGYDQVYLIDLDKRDNIVVVGQTSTNSSSWVSNAAWSNGNGQFISKLSNNLTNIIWSTSFGNSSSGPNLSPAALMVDQCGDIHVTGWGSTLFAGTGLTLSGMPTYNPIQATFDSDGFYFMSISGDASNLKFASTFGGLSSQEHVDGGTSRYDKRGCVYQSLCAGCHGNNDFPVTPNVVGPTNNSGLCNMGVIKMDFILGTVVADFSMPPTACAYIPINYLNRSKEYSNATKYFWSFGDGATDTVKDPTHTYLTAGTYTVTLIVTDTSSCNYADTLSKQIIISNNKSDTLPDLNICKGDFTRLLGILPPTTDPNVTCTWYPPTGLDNPNSCNPAFKDTVSRIYTLIRETALCSDTFRQRANVISLAPPKNIELTRCKGDTLLFATDTSGQIDSYVWSSNPFFSDTLNKLVTSPYINLIVNQSVTYYLRRTKSVCEARDTLKINASSFDLLLEQPPTICFGDTVELNVTTQNSVNSSSYTYQWQPTGSIAGNSRISNPLAIPQKSTYFSVSVTNRQMCVMKDSVLVNVIVLVPNIIVNQISCYGLTDGSISINMSGGDMPYSYRWFHTAADTSYLRNLQKGLYRVQVTDSNNCRIDTSIAIIEPPALSLALQNIVDTVFCDEICSGQVLAVASGGTPPYSFNWITGDTTALLDSLCAGKYTLWLKDSRGCRDTIIFEVNDTSSMEVDWTSEPASCFDECNGNVQIVIIEAVPPCRYIWKTGDTTDFVDSLCRGTYDISVIDDQHCTRRIFAVVDSPPPIVVDSSIIIHPYCRKEDGGSILVYIGGGTPPYTYFWDGNLGTNSLTDLRDARGYVLTIVDSNGCMMIDTLFLLDFDTLSIQYQTNNIPCFDVCNGSATAIAAGGLPPYFYVWTDDGKTTPTIKNLCAGEYEVTVYDFYNCFTTAVVPVFVDTTLFPTSVRAWSDSATIYRSQSTTIYGSDYGNKFDYTWSPNDYLNTTKGTKAVSTPLNTIIYTYKASDTNGCEIIDTLLITVLDVICEDPYIFVPNAFSPNGDGLNDILYVRGNVLEKVDFAIYDRWGEKLFETKDKNIGWDGTFRGKPCSPDVYVYYLDANCIGGERYQHKGNVTLIR